jgi:hypothetical protein
MLAPSGRGLGDRSFGWGGLDEKKAGFIAGLPFLITFVAGS